ncbi:efflux RND transporter permease subunit [Paenibacillus alkalitolerans]|uniref:efflux RND transporter permease subunit n=1 Tax=Paenibacillus alkalitolerans TaxID=2799335 RepID=UPI0018F57B5B|nr:efflux RND transporter permease subunit [Paenibacillus alkalitolerans]
MSRLTKFSLKNTVAVMILCLLVIAAGVFSTSRIGVETFPDVTFPAAFVQTVYPGSSTEEVETAVTIPLEEQLLPLKGYDDLTSTTSEFSSAIFIMYPFGTDMDEKIAEVESAIEKADLPEQAETTVRRLSPNSTPIYEAAVTAEGETAEQLERLLTEEVVPDIEKIAGVSSVELAGAGESEIVIRLDEEKARAQGLTLSSIRDAIKNKDYALPLGNVTEDGVSIPVRLAGGIDGIEELKNLSFTVMPQQAPAGAAGAVAPQPKEVKLSEVAEVDVVTERKEIARYNGKDSFLITVVKEQDANTAAVADEVKDALAQYEESDGLSFAVITDMGEEVEHSVATLIKEGGYGALFTVLVIFIFLRNIRATVIAVLSLPLSVLMTISILDITDNTLNIMTLGGLAVAIGRIVDDSIVIIENIFRWRQEKGSSMSGRELAYRAAKEVLGPVASSTIATVVVFLPLAFVSGIIGEFFTPFAIAVVSSILCSLLVAVTLIPVLGSRFFRNVKHKEKESFLVRRYEPVLRSALRRKRLVFTLSVLLLAGSFAVIPLLGVSFLPAGGEVSVQANVKLPAEAGLEQTKAIAEKAEEYLAGVDEVESTYLRIGIGNNREAMFGPASNDTASFTLLLKEGAEAAEFIDRVNTELTELAAKEYPGAEVSVNEVAQQGPPSGNNVDIMLYGSNGEHLAEAARQIEDYLKSNDQLKNVANSLSDVQPKWVVRLNEEGEAAGVNAFAVMAAVSERLRPTAVDTYRWNDADWEVSIEYDEKIDSLDKFKDIAIMTPVGPKQLGDIADIEQSTAPVSIRHEKGRMNASVSATIESSDTRAVSTEVKEDVLALSLPDGVGLEVGGGLEMIAEGFADLGLAMVTAVGLVFLVLSVTFGGLLTPAVILTSLIFVPIGSFTGLLIAGQTLSMSAMIGLLMLIGVVVTNAVVLLQRIEENRKEGLTLNEAIVEASKTRLRPILMTAFATVFALIPMAVSESTSGLISKGLAITVIGGLTTSTLLTLIFVPALYSAVGRFRKLDAEVGTSAERPEPSAARAGRLEVH